MAELASPPSDLVLTGERTLPGHRPRELLVPSARGGLPRAAAVRAGRQRAGGGLRRGVRRRCACASGRARCSPSTPTSPRPSTPPGPTRRSTSSAADLQKLPVADGALEVVTNLQVIEHLWDQEEFLAECARALRPAGTLLITTPNRITFSPGRDTPLNPFHTRELSAAELAELLEKDFVVTRMMGLGHGPRLRRWERRHGSVMDQQLAGPPDDAGRRCSARSSPR